LKIEHAQVLEVLKNEHASAIEKLDGEEGEAENMGEAGPQVNQEGHFGFGAAGQQQQQNFNFANGGDSMDM
jgi:hypothetical protein